MIGELMKPLKKQHSHFYSCLLLVATLLMGTAFAQTPRISEEYRKELLVDVKEGILEYKEEFGTPLDLKKMRGEVLEYIYEFYDERVASPEEINGFVAEFDKLSERIDLDDAQKEEALIALFNNVVDTINKSPLQCLAEGAQCNDWTCCDGLTCAAKPQDHRPSARGGKCQTVESTCSKDSECCTGYCHEDFSTKVKSCRPKMQCFKPVKLNASCNDNPVCQEGSCLEFNLATSSVLVCELNGTQCSKNTDCCSGLCDGKTCRKNSVCKDCVPQGQIPERGRRCCEGLMLDKDGRCIIDRPPFMMPSGNVGPSLLQEIANLIIPTASAQVDSARNAISNTAEGELWSTGGVVRDEQSREDIRASALEVNRNKTAANQGGNLNFTLRPRSDFEACTIHFKNDFMWGLKEKNVYNYQLTLLGFEYVALGDGTQDLWEVRGNISDTGPANIHGALKAVATESRDTRREIFAKIDEREEEIRCLCYDKNGYDSLDAEQKQFFEAECPELHAIYLAELEAAKAMGQENLNAGDASGIKYKVMFAKWIEATKDLEEEVFLINSNVERKLNNIGRWMASNDWNATEVKNIPLFNFTVKNPSGRIAVASAATAALLSAGIIVITGGFAATATLSVWAAAGIITASAAAGGMGGWLVDSLRGAWASKAPIVQDEYVRGRENYKCGKKDRCADFKRILRQPYNRICNKHISANACIKSFLTMEEEGENRYLIDPWIPLNVSTRDVIKDSRDYSTLLESGFNRARSHLAAKAPVGQQSDAYLERTFVDEVAAGMFTPTLNTNSANYQVTAELETEVEDKAKAYAIAEGFFYEDERDNLNLFGQYVWDYHFVFPRKTLTDAIAYPPPGFTDYIELVGLAASFATANNLDTRNSLAQVFNLVLDDLATTISGFGTGIGLQNFLDAAGIDKDFLASGNKGETRIGAGINLNLDPKSFTPDMVRQLGDSSEGSNLIDGGDLIAGSGSDQFQNALANHNRLKEERKEANENFKKQMGDTERGKALMEAQAATVRNFFSPFGTSGAGAANTLASNDLSAARGAALNADSKEEKDASFQSNFNPDAFNLNSGANSGSRSRVGNDGFGAGSSSGSGSSGGVSDADAQRMREAIAARDEMGDEAFEAKDGDSIWEIVTNTYIRVYDKLLPKKSARVQDLE